MSPRSWYECHVGPLPDALLGWLEAVRSWIRWHRPVTFGTAARLVDAERALIDRRLDAERARIDLRVDALFRAMSAVCDHAGFHEDAARCRIAAYLDDGPPPRPLHSVKP